MSDHRSPEVARDARKESAVSQRWKCEDCGGDLDLVDSVNSDAHATESFECVDCGATGNVQFFEGPDSPRIYGSVVHK